MERAKRNLKTRSVIARMGVYSLVVQIRGTGGCDWILTGFAVYFNPVAPNAQGPGLTGLSTSCSFGEELHAQHRQLLLTKPITRADAWTPVNEAILDSRKQTNCITAIGQMDGYSVILANPGLDDLQCIFCVAKQRHSCGAR
jgi:hypothetical protein